MRHEPLLTRDELSFLRQLLDEPEHASQPASELLLDSSAANRTLLASLGETAQLTLEVLVDGQRLTFPLRLSQDGYSALRLQLQAPQILEKSVTRKGLIERAWRATLDTPLSLLDKAGRATALHVQQISQSGVLVSSDDDSEPPEHFTLSLALPDQAPLSLRGKRVRQISTSLAAYRITPLQRNGGARLQEFLVQLRNQEHPLQQFAR